MYVVMLLHFCPQGTGKPKSSPEGVVCDQGDLSSGGCLSPSQEEAYGTVESPATAEVEGLERPKDSPPCEAKVALKWSNVSDS